MNLPDRLRKIEEDIRIYAPGRDVTLVAVTKYASVAQMTEAYAAGVRHFGENKVQDALAKMEAFPPESFPDLHWHFIGHLQRNKIKKTVGRFQLIHSLESSEQAKVLSETYMRERHCQPVLLQVNLSKDETRHGFRPSLLPQGISEMLPLPGIRLRGLMAMAPAELSLNKDNEALKRCFAGLADLRAQLEAEFGIALPDLSMGMSHDYVPALQSGATIIRIGNFLFQNA